MEPKSFDKFFQEHRAKIHEAWNKLTEKDLDAIDGDLEVFLDRVSKLYQIPKKVLLREIDRVKKNIEEGIQGDFAYRLDPDE